MSGADRSLSPETDVTVVTDPRFMGGTAQALLSDVEAFLAAGLRVGIVLFRSGRFFRPGDLENPDLLALRDRLNVTVSPRRTGALFMHNPQIFGAPQLVARESPLDLPQSHRQFVVAHHPPFLGDGALCYDPVSTTSALARLMPRGAPSIEWLPVSGLVRRQLRSFLPFLRLHPNDWPNAFDVARWGARRAKLSGPEIVIGRHGRAHPDKWPDTARDIAASLPSGPRTRVRVLGADPAYLQSRGVDVSEWEVLPFGATSPDSFLDGLDLFSYFHASQWREAFGRTVAEAMLMQVPCLLDKELRPTFGPHALYPAPAEVPALIDAIRTDPAAHLARATEAATWCRQSFDSARIKTRLDAVLSVRAVRRRVSPVDSSPLTTLRKWAGFHRRARVRPGDATTEALS